MRSRDRRYRLRAIATRSPSCDRLEPGDGVTPKARGPVRGFLRVNAARLHPSAEWMTSRGSGVVFQELPQSGQAGACLSNSPVETSVLRFLDCSKMTRAPETIARLRTRTAFTTANIQIAYSNRRCFQPAVAGTHGSDRATAIPRTSCGYFPETAQ